MAFFQSRLPSPIPAALVTRNPLAVPLRQQQQHRHLILAASSTIGSGLRHAGSRIITSQPSTPRTIVSLRPKTLNPWIKKSSPSPERLLHSTTAVQTSKAIIHDVFEEATGTWQFIVADPSTLKAVIIDPVLDYDRATRTVTTPSADKLLSMTKDNSYEVEMILETHVHADHLTAASYLQHRISKEQRLRPSIGIGKRIRQVQEKFGERYGIPTAEYERVFDKLLDDDEIINIGELNMTAIHLPGHTPDHLGYKIGENIFCGDSLFNVDIGTARCDFPGGSAKDLYKSGQKLLSLSEDVKIWPGHDYPPGERGPKSWTTVQQHKEQNLHFKDGTSEKVFIATREKRDRTLAPPKLLHESLQFNIRAGRLPTAAGSAGFRLLHLPLNLKGMEW